MLKTSYTSGAMQGLEVLDPGTDLNAFSLRASLYGTRSVTPASKGQL